MKQPASTCVAKPKPLRSVSRLLRPRPRRLHRKLAADPSRGKAKRGWMPNPSPFLIMAALLAFCVVILTFAVLCGLCMLRAKRLFGWRELNDELLSEAHSGLPIPLIGLDLHLAKNYAHRHGYKGLMDCDDAVVYFWK